MKNIIIILICISFAASVFSQDSFTLKLDTDAIVLTDHYLLTISGRNSAELTHKLTVQINNENGKEYSEWSFRQSEYLQLNDIEAVIKDLDGNIVRELDEDDIHHSSISRDISDVTTHWFNLYSAKYPYIFELTEEYELTSLLNLPEWNPQSKIPVLDAQFRIIKEVPIGLKRYPINMDVNPNITTDGRDSIFTWRMTNIPARDDIYRCPPENKYNQKVLFACTEFKVDNFVGSAHRWDDFARWIREIYADCYNLSNVAKAEAQALVASCKNNRDRVKTLYSFLQKNTRYVAIELGLGKWRPYSADWVHNKKYGDCKDLSIYMISLLDAVGLQAYPALIKTRNRGKLFTDFPCNQFNHVIVFVPLKSDTLWLEVTSDYLSAGELPYNDQGCDVLVIHKNKSEVLTTPLSQSVDNCEITTIRGTLKSWSGLEFEAQFHFTGNDKIYMDYISNTYDEHKLQNYMRGYLGRFESTPELADYAFYRQEFTTSLNLNGQYKNFVNQSKRRIFLNPNIFNRVDFDEELVEKTRVFPIFYKYPFIEIDTTVVAMPIARGIESAPNQIDIDNTFGRYKIAYSYAENTLTYIRHFEIKQRMIPADQYEAYVRFMLKVEEYDNKKFVIKKF
jgi:hypothetical protein